MLEKQIHPNMYMLRRMWEKRHGISILSLSRLDSQKPSARILGTQGQSSWERVNIDYT